MQQQTISINPSSRILINTVHGDLRVAGWDRSEIMVKTDGDSLSLDSSSDPITISCDEDLIIYLPRSADLRIETVSGDASFQALTGPVSLGPVAGDLSMNDLGPVTLEAVSGDASLRNIGALNAATIGGDLTLRGGHGICAVESVGSDASLRDVDGMLTIDNVGADLYVRNVHASVTIKAGADITFYAAPLPGQIYDVSAGDDLIVRLPPDASVRLNLTASSAESIQVDFPGIQLPQDSNTCEVILGEEKEDMPKMLLLAGDDLLVTNQADPWKSAADFDSGEWRIPPIPPIPPLPPDFSERINQRVQASMERAKEHLESASRRTEARVQAAVRRAEMKARAAEVRVRRGAQFDVNVGRWHWDLAPKAAGESGDTVSDEERLIILRMLQEKKVSLAEAEKLLAALEGK
jgi:hypothetical protein